MGQRSSSSVLPSMQETKSTLTVSIDYEIDSPRFSVHDAQKVQEGIEYLNKHGFAVFADILSPDEITSNIDLFWKHLENLPVPYHIQRDNAKTWDFLWPGIARLGIMSNDGIGHSQFMWSVRGNPNIKKIFSQIWQTSELLVSFDAAGCFRDWRLNPTWKTTSGWYHCDQHPIRKPNRCSIQGLVSLTDGNEFTGGLVIVPDSHNHFGELQSLVSAKNRQDDYVVIPSQHPLLQQLKPHLVKCKAGDLIVWDSRCIHCNTPALDINDETKEEMNTNENKAPRLLRIVTYVCMGPTAMVTSVKLEEFRKTREKFVRDRVACTHWPHELNASSLPQSDEKQALKLNAYQQSLIVGTNVDANDATLGAAVDI
ncbi:unnamed protein product [Rotaria sp. Silwood1]|nr:unnamed protein product [Rotaria sp. Silwood1]CAF4841049.1 unnamed protein product [Rotaria sp. Silwood1]